MKKWQELFFGALFNISVALIAGGILKLVLDFSRILPAVVIVICGFYLLFVVTFMAKYIEMKGCRMDASAYAAVAVTFLATLMLVWVYKDSKKRALKN